MFNNFTGTPLSSLPGPPPVRLTPIDQAVMRDSWTSRNNIWQQPSTGSNSTCHDQTTTKSGSNQTSNLWGTHLTGGLGVSHRYFQDVADMSKTAVAGASTSGDHNTSASPVAGSHMLIPSAPISNRPMGPLTSPTRLRGNGIPGTDPNMTMTSLGQSSLLSGSAPEPPYSSTLTYNTRKGQPIGRRGGSFNIEGAEEFVPLYLRSKKQPAHQRHQYTNDEIANFHHLNVNGTADRRHDHHASSVQRPERMSGEKSQLGMLGTGPRAAVGMAEADPYNVHNTTPSTARSQLDQIHADRAQDAWDGRQFEDSFTFGDIMTTARKTSNLRPDVASYQPYQLYNSTDKNNGFDYDRGYAWNGRNGHSATSSDIHSQTTARHGSLTNSHAFNHNPPASVTPGLTSGGMRHQAANYSAGDRNEFGGGRSRTFGVDTQSRVFGSVALPMPSAKFSTESDTASYFAASGPSPYNNGQFEFGLDASAALAQQYQQNCAVDQTTAALNCYPDGHHLQDPESNSAPRSELLEEFRAYHKTRKYELKDIYGYIVEFSGDQTGSRFIQNKLEGANSDEKDQIFAELQVNARQLMSDVFGNYVIQKMFDHGSQSHKKALASYMQGNVLKLSLQPYGCRCVQKAFERILTDQQAALIKELDGHVMTVVESQHGNHVIQKAIECIPGEHIQFIVDAHRNQIVRLSKHTYGCRIIQRMLEYCTPTARRSILDELQYAIPSLIDDQFGNYVIQCIIEKCSRADRRHVIGFVQQKLLAYSMHKFASNVVEKAIDCADEPQRSELLRELTSPSSHFGGQSPVFTLLRDQYGNYVMQTVLKKIQEPYRQILARQIRTYIDSIGRVSRGKQISAMVDTINAITASHSPSSVSTGPHSPRTPTSSNSGSGAETPMTKVVDDIPPEYASRDAQHHMTSLKPFHT